MKFRLRPIRWSPIRLESGEPSWAVSAPRVKEVRYDVELKTGYFFWRIVAADVSMAEAQTAMTEIQTAYLTYEIK